MKPHRGEEIRSIYVQSRRRYRLRVPLAVYQHKGIPALTRLEMTCTQHAQRTRSVVNPVTGCSRWHIYFRRGCTLSTEKYFLEQECGSCWMSYYAKRYVYSENQNSASDLRISKSGNLRPVRVVVSHISVEKFSIFLFLHSFVLSSYI